MIPLRISFEDENFDFTFDTAVDIIFLFDIYLNFNTGFYKKGILIMEPKSILKNYLKGWFWLDFMASFPV